MDYIFHYDICALILLACTAVVFCLKNRVPCMANKMFVSLLVVTTLSTFFDLLSVISDIDWGWKLKFFIHTAYYVTHNLIPVVFLSYIFSYVKKLQTLTLKFRLHAFLPGIINEALIITSPFTKLIFYVDKEGNYFRGPVQPVCYIVAIYYMVFLMFYVFRNRRKFSRQVFGASMLFVLIVLIAVITQMLNPRVLVECFSCALCMMILMFTLQNQDDSLDSTTKLLNRSMFINNCGIKFHSDNPFSILVIRIPDFALLFKSFGIHFTKVLLMRFAEYLSTFVNLGEGYYLEDDCFALTFSKASDIAGIQNICDEINAKLQNTCRVGTMDTILSVYFLRIDCPYDANSVEDTMDYIEDFKTFKTEDGKVLHVEDINCSDRKRKEKIQKAIDRAIKIKSFQVYYQPIYFKQKNKIISCEALVRLNDEELGFIPVSEENGTILKIGKIVFEEVCKFLQKGVVKSYGIEYIQVNLSVVQCMQSDLVKDFAQIMEKYNVSPRDICLEITETASAYVPCIMEGNIQALSEMGIRFALDDFGTGYCNISYLLNYPFRFVKFEKDIVWQSFENDKAHIAIESTVAMVEKLQMNIVAEGVETVEQLNALLDMGCNYIQGYYFSRPVPESKFLAVLKKQNNISG